MTPLLLASGEEAFVATHDLGAYPGSLPYRFSMEAPAGAVTAIHGESGAGMCRGPLPDLG